MSKRRATTDVADSSKTKTKKPRVEKTEEKKAGEEETKSTRVYLLGFDMCGQGWGDGGSDDDESDSDDANGGVSKDAARDGPDPDHAWRTFDSRAELDAHLRAIYIRKSKEFLASGKRVHLVQGEEDADEWFLEDDSRRGGDGVGGIELEALRACQRLTKASSEDELASAGLGAWMVLNGASVFRPLVKPIMHVSSTASAGGGARST